MNIHMNASFPLVQIVIALIGLCMYLFCQGKAGRVGEILFFCGCLSALTLAR